MTFTKKESLEARRELKELIKDFGTKTVYVVQRHVSRSGMQRQLELYLIPSVDKVKRDYDDGEIPPRNITYLAAQALQWVYNENYECIQVGGCGMDMHFHTVYSLSYVLFEGDKTLNKHDQGYYLTHRTI